ncbi:MAG: DMT family transporter [Firmicutes bacterium]|nr:DMT family transporter [Bacillota bacterium]
MKKELRAGTGFFCMLIILQSIIYGFGDPISKAAYEAMPVYSLLSLRYIIAMAIILLFAGKKVWTGLKQYHIKDWLLPSVCMALSYILNNIGLQLTAATSVAFLRSLSVVITPILAWLVYRKSINKKLIPILIFIVIGLYLLCGLGGLATFGLGEIVTLLAALMVAGSLVFGEKALKKMDALTLTATQTMVSAVIATICAFAFNGGWSLNVTTPSIWFTILYLGIVCTIFGYLLQNIALQKIPDRTVALLQCSCPVLTAAFSFLILGEMLSTPGIIGAIIILICVSAATLLKEK